MTGATLDTGALIALEAGNPWMRGLVRRAAAEGVTLAVPAGVLAQAWRGGARQARIASLVRLPVTEVVPLDRPSALMIGELCRHTGAEDVVDVSVVLCARRWKHRVVTTDPQDLAAIDPGLALLRPGSTGVTG